MSSAEAWRFRWGETEYGIGWLPLGGYVKMLGQEDNPARLREEIARAKAQQAAQNVRKCRGGLTGFDAGSRSQPRCFHGCFHHAGQYRRGRSSKRSTWLRRNKPSTTPVATSPRAFPSGWRSFPRA